MVEAFNRSHDDVQIEVRNYYDEDGFSGKQRLLVEIASGNVPDIIDLGRSESMLPYEMLARKGILEDLWPYIENDPDLGRESLWESPLKAAEVDGGLYVAFNCASIDTLAGRESVVGNRYSWTLDELREAFADMPDDSTVLEFFTTKGEMFSDLFVMSLDEYVDWKTGECSFDSEKFRSELEFVNSFPREVDARAEATAATLTDEISDRIRQGRQMLIYSMISNPQTVEFYDRFFGQGETVSFVGFPNSDGHVGSGFRLHGNTLAMSSACQNKEAAWEFIRKLFLPQYESDDVYKNNPISIGFPINLSDYDRMKRYATGKISGVTFSTSEMSISHKATAEHVERFEDLVNHVDRIALGDREIYNIVYEVADSYFAGDKTLDETVEIIQRRVGLYIGEMR